MATNPASDFNQQLFQTGLMPGSGACGSTGAGPTEDPKKSSFPLLAALGIVIGKDSQGWLKMADANFIASGPQGLGGLFNPKSGDKALQALQKTGDGTAGPTQANLDINIDLSSNHHRSAVDASRSGGSDIGLG